MTYKLVITWNMTLRVCLNRSAFLLFSLSRELSPFLLHEQVLSLLYSLEAFYSFPPFHVSRFVFSHFNSLPPASLSLLLHFNCDFHGYLTRSRSTCIKCPSGINLLLVLKPRLFGQGYPTDIPLTVRNSLTTTDFKKKLRLYFLSLNWISPGLSYFIVSLFVTSTPSFISSVGLLVLLNLSFVSCFTGFVI